ncbi:MAG TPA: hypothetical protein VKL40_11950 [Candidatus Angelobacter sp.]|nr:hypothetical protein [Candidatus Angelobacter sp.]
MSKNISALTISALLWLAMVFLHAQTRSTAPKLPGPPSATPAAPALGHQGAAVNVLKAQITGLTLVHSQAVAAVPLEFRVEGLGQCSFRFFVGDDIRGVGVAGAKLPASIPYQFPVGGRFRLTARAMGTDCQGEASTTVTVQGLGDIVIPAPVSALRPAAITVDGAGSCGGIVLEFGDSSAPASLSGNLPQHVTHVYQHGGTYTLTARPTAGSQCNPARTQATVRVSDATAARLPCAAQGIEISHVWASGGNRGNALPIESSGVIVPGERLYVTGRNLGDGPGEVRLVGNFPGGSLRLNPLPNGWKDADVWVEVPAVTGAMDQPVRIEVVTRTACVSNSLALRFKANREERLLPLRMVRTLTCSQASSRNNCISGALEDADVSLWGVHSGSLLSDPTNGRDEYRTDALKNGWVFKRYQWKTRTRTWDPPEGFVAGATRLDRLVVRWEYPPGTNMESIYRLQIYIEGPAGVPFE